MSNTNTDHYLKQIANALATISSQLKHINDTLIAIAQAQNRR